MWFFSKYFVQMSLWITLGSTDHYLSLFLIFGLWEKLCVVQVIRNDVETPFMELLCTVFENHRKKVSFNILHSKFTKNAKNSQFVAKQCYQTDKTKIGGKWDIFGNFQTTCFNTIQFFFLRTSSFSWKFL